LFLHQRRAQERITVRKDRSEGEGLVETPEERTEKTKLPDRRFDGELEEDSSEGSELLVGIDSSDVQERLEGGVDALRFGRLDGRGEDVEDRQSGELKTRDVHRGRGEVGTEHLDGLVDVHRGETGVRNDTVVLSCTVTTGTTGALKDVGRSGPRRNELRETAFGVVALLLTLGGIDDVNDVRNGDRRFGDVGRKDDTTDSGSGRFEDGLLLRDGDRRVEDVDFVLLRVEVDVEEGEPSSIEEHVTDRLDLVPSGEEDEDVTFLGDGEDVGDEEGDKRVRHVEVVDFSDGLAGTVVDRDGGDEFALKVGDDRLLVEDPSSAVGRKAHRLEGLDRLVKPVLLDGEGATCERARGKVSF
jgi:hypothetical protein